MLRYRLTLGPVMIAALIGVFWLDEHFARPDGHGLEWFLRPGFAMYVLGIMACSIAAWELKLLFRALGVTTSRGLMTVSAAAGLAIPWVIPDTLHPLTAMMIAATGAAGVLVVSLVFYSRRRNPKSVTMSAAATVFSFVYLGIMLGFILALRREHSAWIVVDILVITKSCDIGAFATGKLIGRHKLILWLSPGKTWEGLVGGIVTASLMGVLFVWIIRQTQIDHSLLDLEYWEGALLGFFLALIGQTGDLLASLLKRDAGVKDSSSAIPGYGGLLDVMDSLVLAGPVAYWLLHRG